MTLQTTIPHHLETLVGAAAVTPWEAVPQADRQRFQAALADPASPGTAAPTCLVAPPSVEALQAVVRCAHQNRWPLLITGSGSKMGWGQPVRGAKIVLSTAQLTQWVDHAVGDLTLTAEVGVPLALAQARLGQEGQFLALDPLWSGTLGGLVATGESGSLRQRYGGVRDMVLGVEFVRSDGEKAKAGGRVVKNVAGYDLMKLLTGSYGSLGIVTQVTLRLYPRPEQFQSQVIWGAGATVAQLAQTILASTLSPVAIDLVSRSQLSALDLANKAGDLGLILRFGTLPSSNQGQMQEIAGLATGLGLWVQDFGPEDEGSLWLQLQRSLGGNASGAPSIAPSSATPAATPAATQADVPLADPIAPADPAVLLKVGIPSTQVSATLIKIAEILPETALAQVQAGSGLGYVRCGAGELQGEQLMQLRQHCQRSQGYVTVLEAPRSLKESMAVWGYGGNAAGLMRALKQQFDPMGILNPGRSLGG